MKVVINSIDEEPRL